MLSEATLGEGWTVWNATDDRGIAVYRPDVFDESSFPAACLPTVYVSRGRRTRRPEGNRNLPSDAPWLVRLRLEPDVDRTPEAYDTRGEAVSATERLTQAFAAGEIDYRSLYQLEREAYLDALDALTGRE